MLQSIFIGDTISCGYGDEHNSNDHASIKVCYHYNNGNGSLHTELDSSRVKHTKE